MEYRQLGQSDVKVSAITLGTWAVGGWMWGGTDEKDALDAIAAAVDAGITSIDTAPIYGFGRSEEIVGKAVAGRRDKVQLLTKYVLRWDDAAGELSFETTGPDGKPAKVYRNARPASIIAECEQSLRRLRTDVIDLYQCHWRDHTTPVEETMTAIDKLLKDGKIRAAGVSNFTAEDIAAARKVVPLASDQPPYSMLRRDAEKEVLPYCRGNNIGVVVYSPLQLGILSGQVTMDTRYTGDDLRRRSPWYTPDNRRKVIGFIDGTLRPIAEAHDATVAQVVVNWTIHRPGVTAALVGARKARHARENAGAAAFKLTDAETARIDAALDSLDLDVHEPLPK